VTDIEYELLSARYSDDGVYGSPLSTAVVAAAGGLNVSIAANVGASVRGHYWTSGDEPITLPIDANSSGATRYDMVVLRLDRSTWEVTAEIRKGVAGAGAPALVRDTGGSGLWEVPLAQATVPAGATSVTVQRREMYVGARIRPCTSTTRPPYPVIGEQAYETDTGRLLVWTGLNWLLVHSPPTWAEIDTPVSGWAVSVSSVVEMGGGSVHLRLGTWERTGGTLANTTDSRLPVLIPAAYRHPLRAQYATAYVTGAGVARLTIHAANSDKPGQVWLTQKPTISKDDFVMASSISWLAG
jgi:hypothetical protein